MAADLLDPVSPLGHFKFSYGKFEILATKRAGSNYTRSNDS